MGDLQRQVRRTGRSGNFVYATLENISSGQATVILTGSNQKLVNLQVLTEGLERGDRVIVDYSGGVPPIVRGIGQSVSEEESMFSDDFVDLTVMQDIEPPDISASVMASENQVIPKDTGNLVYFDTTIFDEQSMFVAPYYLVTAVEGVFLVSAQIIVDGISCDYDPQNRVWAALQGNEYGTFAIESAQQHEHAPNYPIQINVSGVITAEEGESVSCRAWLDSSFGQNSADIIDENAGPWAAASPTLQMIKLGGNFPEENLFRIEFPNYYDPASIELQDNRGFMFTTGALSYARAIANSKEQSDQELTLDFKWGNTDAESHFSLFLRSSIDWWSWSSPTDGYELQISNTGGWRLRKYDSGVRTMLGSTNSPETDSWQSLRFEVVGDTIRAKIWMQGEIEPASWDLEITDTGSLGAGGFQLGHFNQGGTRQLKIDNVNLDTP